jgi:hypothetical protein
MAGKWSTEHQGRLEREECDVWLLTEVHDEAKISGMQPQYTNHPMGPHKSWAAIFSRLEPEKGPDPHFGTAAARVGGVRFLSSVLPWRSCGPSWPGSTLAEKQAATLGDLRPHIDGSTVWGGDWNQAFEGRDYVGTLAGRDAITKALEANHLSLPTKPLRSATSGHRSIDHIAVPVGWDVQAAYRVSAQVQGHRLSDHDAYVVVTEVPTARP